MSYHPINDTAISLLSVAWGCGAALIGEMFGLTAAALVIVLPALALIAYNNRRNSA